MYFLAAILEFANLVHRNPVLLWAAIVIIFTALACQLYWNLWRTRSY